MTVGTKPDGRVNDKAVASSTSPTVSAEAAAVEPDEIPVLMKVELGEHLLSRIRLSNERRGPVSGSFRLAGSTNRVLFYCDVIANWDVGNLEQQLNPFLLGFAAVRHQEHEETVGPGRTLLLSRLQGEGTAVARTISLIDGPSGDAAPTSEMRWAIAKQFGVHSGTEVRDVDSFERNERCPFGSGLK